MKMEYHGKFNVAVLLVHQQEQSIFRIYEFCKKLKNS